MRIRIEASSSVSVRPSPSDSGSASRPLRRASCSSSSRTASARAAAVHAAIGVGDGWFCASREISSWGTGTSLTDTALRRFCVAAFLTEQPMASLAGWTLRRGARRADRPAARAHDLVAVWNLNPKLVGPLIVWMKH